MNVLGFWLLALAIYALVAWIGGRRLIPIVGQLLVLAFEQAAHSVWVGSVSIHLFTFGVMGLIIPAMIIRISNGHTGRKVVFDRLDKLLLKIMIAAFALLLCGPQLRPEAYIGWIHASATCWFICFGLLGWRYIPRLMQPRVDGKEH